MTISNAWNSVFFMLRNNGVTSDCIFTIRWRIRHNSYGSKEGTDIFHRAGMIRVWSKWFKINDSGGGQAWDSYQKSRRAWVITSMRKSGVIWCSDVARVLRSPVVFICTSSGTGPESDAKICDTRLNSCIYIVCSDMEFVSPTEYDTYLNAHTRTIIIADIIYYSDFIRMIQ